MKKHVNVDDVLTNLLIKSKLAIESGVVLNDHQMNYNKIYEDPKYEEVSYVDALADLEEMNELFKKRIDEKNKFYNFFLDDGQTTDHPIAIELYEQYEAELQKGEIFCYTTHNTWTKGKDFFFIQKGTVMKIVHIYPDRIFADLTYHGKVGLIKFAELKIIISNPDSQM